MKKKLIIILVAIIVLIAFLIGLYFYGLTPVSKTSREVTININTGSTKIDIINELKDAGLIKSKFAGYIYVGLNRNLNLKAGEYLLNANMDIKEIINVIDEGLVSKSSNTYSITFIEGKRLTSYANQIASAVNLDSNEVLKIINDKEYLKELINNYWFLTDEILNDKIYYGLEGYLFPNTYEFYSNSSVKDIITTMLNTLDSKLKTYEEEIKNSGYTVHEIITMASIVEQEGANSKDRAGVAGVFYNRLKAGISLGSDATTYYAVNKDYSVDLSQTDLDTCNGYNTRGACVSGLTVGPICSPGLSSLIATIEPAKHDYYYFVADKYKETYFTKTYAEHEQQVTKLRNEGKWFEY